MRLWKPLYWWIRILWAFRILYHVHLCTGFTKYPKIQAHPNILGARQFKKKNTCWYSTNISHHSIKFTCRDGSCATPPPPPDFVHGLHSILNIFLHQTGWNILRGPSRNIPRIPPHPQFTNIILYSQYIYIIMRKKLKSSATTKCTGLFKITVGVITTCHTQYTWDMST